jgi:hypothetical protein
MRSADFGAVFKEDLKWDFGDWWIWLCNRECLRCDLWCLVNGAMLKGGYVLWLVVFGELGFCYGEVPICELWCLVSGLCYGSYVIWLLVFGELGWVIEWGWNVTCGFRWIEHCYREELRCDLWCLVSWAVLYRGAEMCLLLLVLCYKEVLKVDLWCLVNWAVL